MGQAWSTLRPFNRFLAQAIHTAKQRQFRYQLPWEPVRNVTTVRLDPLDSLLRIPRRRPELILPDWPAEKAADCSKPGFVIVRSQPVRVEVARHTEAGLVIRTDVPLQTTDRLTWCGIECAVEQETAASPPLSVVDLQGRALKLVSQPQEDDDGQHWLLIVEGQHSDCDLVVDGYEVEAEALPSIEGLRRVLDVHGRPFDVSGGVLRAEEAPAEGALRGDNGVRYRWSEGSHAGRRGNWIQLLPPETSDEDYIDPRAAFCEGDVSEIWTQPRHNRETTIKVKKIDKDRYQLQLERFPPPGTTLYLPVDQRNLMLQMRALRQLAEAPLPHHQGLLRLCEDPQKVQWPPVRARSIPDTNWRSLTNPERSGTSEQRSFVCKALSTKDFAFLEGPPGSGKTTAICEIVQQLVEQGQRVLLCASTHVAIDNVLERLLASDSPIDAVRIGLPEKLDDKVLATQIDVRVKELVTAWRVLPGMQMRSEAELKEMAERTVIMAANLTCGTTMGIVRHPLFQGKDEDLRTAERPITTVPHWDVLIVDEASKTLIQEFMVPALMAKRWIIVGDVRQLPPFADRADIVANLRDLVDEDDRPVFPSDHQRACLILFRLHRRQVRQPGMRWLIVERPAVLEAIAAELRARATPGPSVVRVVSKPIRPDGPVNVVTVAQLKEGKPEALHLAAADWVMVGDDLLREVSELLPSNLLFAEEMADRNGPNLHEGDVLLMRQGRWLARAGSLEQPYTERKHRKKDIATMADSQACEADWLSRSDLAQELAWRLTRLHELRHSRNEQERGRLRRDLDRLLPVAADIAEPVAEIEDIGLPSILEVLQDGIGVDRAKRRSALTTGMRASRRDEFDARFESLSFQHRMHPQIASFSREIIYVGQALKDANTIQIRDAELDWNFGDFHGRREWAHIDGRDDKGVNLDEVRVIAAVLREFIAWARKKGPPKRESPRVWEVACLCFYVAQERAMSDMLRALTQDDRRTRFQVHDAPVEIVCGTVDRFQGREADLVMLSMRNTNRVGFLDSPNRLNVAVTRARQQLVVVGNADYFRRCGVSELEQLSVRTPMVNSSDVQRWRRASR
jgi:hypothetical protein